jgi:hypothetical protein
LNHKRGKAKNQRAGCLMCKGWKINGFSKNSTEFETMSSHKSRIFADQDIKEFMNEGTGRTDSDTQEILRWWGCAC